MRKLIAKHPWLLVVAGLIFFMILSLTMLVIALLHQPKILPH